MTQTKNTGFFLGNILGLKD